MKKNTSTSIIIADDHSLVRQSLRLQLENNPLFKVVALCENGESAIAQTLKLKPDILILDINMPEMDGFEVTKKINSAKKTVKIIGMSIEKNPEYARKIIKLGAAGFVTKTSPPEEFVLAITEVLSGKKYICEEVRNYK